MSIVMHYRSFENTSDHHILEHRRNSHVQNSTSVRSNAPSYLIPKRYIFSLLSFTACSLAVSNNMNLSIAIVGMLDHTETNNTNTYKGVYVHSSAAQESFAENGKLQWDAQIEGTALGAVYYGQLISFIPGGRMAELFGGKKMLIICTLWAAVASLLSPIAAMYNAYAFIVIRMAVGIGTGPIIPIVFFMLSRWIPTHERSFHASFILSGYGVGSFLAVIISGSLCDTTFLGGWPSVFYVGGFCGLIWCLVCLYFMHESPIVHPSISDEELLHITVGIESTKKEKIPSIPWKDMARSVPLWALAFGFFGQFWLLGFFSTVHALYMGIVLDLPIVKAGALSCLPHLLRAIATCMASYPVDIMLKNNVVSVGFVRKSATAINSIVSCGAFLAITYAGRSIGATTILFILGGILGEFVTFGVCMAAIDIAPDLSGTVSGILNIVGVFPFFIIPASVGWLTNYEDSLEDWKNVFYTTITIVSISTLIFIVFGDLRPQSWGVVNSNTNSTEEENESSRLLRNRVQRKNDIN